MFWLTLDGSSGPRNVLLCVFAHKCKQKNRKLFMESKAHMQ
jgi:hypothetical protein